VIEAAAALLESGTVSLDAVAKAAGVTRLTIYNQFGSRRGLLEALFDDAAERGGIKELADAARHSDPQAGLHQVVRILCRFWSDHPVIGRLADAAGADPELSEALRDHQGRRRQAIDALLARIPGSAARRADTGDLLAALISPATFRELSARRSAPEITDLLVTATTAILNGSGLGSEDPPRA
jgi:AcrR family transcriptional regulator